MDFRPQLDQLTGQLLPYHVVHEMLTGYKRPNDKIHELLKQGQLIQLKKGLYIVGPTPAATQPEPFLIANHLWGPSYVSLESALSWYGFIPERIYGVTSVTTKVSRKYKTSVGYFSYQHLPLPYYAIGLRQETLKKDQVVMIATPEKALCDKVIVTAGVLFRSQSDAASYLIDDLRIDESSLTQLDTDWMKTWTASAPKKESLQFLIQVIDEIKERTA